MILCARWASAVLLSYAQTLVFIFNLTLYVENAFMTMHTAHSHFLFLIGYVVLHCYFTCWEFGFPSFSCWEEFFRGLPWKCLTVHLCVFSKKGLWKSHRYENVKIFVGYISFNMFPSALAIVTPVLLEKPEVQNY